MGRFILKELKYIYKASICILLSKLSFANPFPTLQDVSKFVFVFCSSIIEHTVDHVKPHEYLYGAKDLLF